MNIHAVPLVADLIFILTRLGKQGRCEKLFTNNWDLISVGNLKTRVYTHT